jgi:hypothetical protein
MEFQTQADVQTQSSAPLPLGQAIRELPGQYIKVLIRPSVKTFEEEKGKARQAGVSTGYSLLPSALSGLSCNRSVYSSHLPLSATWQVLRG